MERRPTPNFAAETSSAAIKGFVSKSSRSEEKLPFMMVFSSPRFIFWLVIAKMMLV